MSEIKNGLVGAADGDFWGDPWQASPEFSDQFTRSLKPALVLDGPNVVPLGARDSLPLAAYRFASDAEFVGAPFRQLAVLTAVRLEDRQVYAALAMEPLPDAVPANAPAGENYTGQGWILQARDRLNLPWKDGHFVFGLIMLDKTSNRIRVHLDSGNKYADPEVKKFLDAMTRPAGPLAAPPGGSLEKQEDSPEAPTEEGIALKVARVLINEPEAKAILHVAFRLKVNKTELVEPDPKAEKAPVAVVSVGLVITGSKLASPDLIAVRVPITEPLEPGEGGDYGIGYFSIDLLEVPEMRQREETLFIYALSGEVQSGPALLALIDPKTAKNELD